MRTQTGGSTLASEALRVPSCLTRSVSPGGPYKHLGQLSAGPSSVFKNSVSLQITRLASQDIGFSSPIALSSTSAAYGDMSTSWQAAICVTEFLRLFCCPDRKSGNPQQRVYLPNILIIEQALRMNHGLLALHERMLGESNARQRLCRWLSRRPICL
jgi:hypothetical protein